MFGKAFVFVFALCLVQSINGDSISDLIKELKPKLEAAGKRVANVTIEGGVTVKDTLVSIQKSLNVLDKELVQERVDLFKIVQKARTDAKEAGKDISACIKQVHKAALNLTGWQFEKCRISPELAHLTVDLSKLAATEAQLVGAPVQCVVKSPKDLAKIKQCVLDIIADVEKQTDEVEASIKPTATSAEQNANKCGQDEAAKLKQTVAQITNDFNDCVSKA